MYASSHPATCMAAASRDAGNKIAVIENLAATQDQFDVIDLSDNEIKKVECMAVLKRLNTLLLHNNRVTRISESLGKTLPNLTALVLTNNLLSTLTEARADRTRASRTRTPHASTAREHRTCAGCTSSALDDSRCSDALVQARGVQPLTELVGGGFADMSLSSCCSASLALTPHVHTRLRSPRSRCCSWSRSPARHRSPRSCSSTTRSQR